MAALGAAHATAQANTVSGDSLGGTDAALPPQLQMNNSFFATDFASRWRGAFRAPITGDCAFTLTAGARAYPSRAPPFTSSTLTGLLWRRRRQR